MDGTGSVTGLCGGTLRAAEYIREIDEGFICTSCRNLFDDIRFDGRLYVCTSCSDIKSFYFGSRCQSCAYSWNPESTICQRSVSNVQCSSCSGTKNVNCGTCNGTGNCKTCNGTGKVSQRYNCGHGYYSSHWYCGCGNSKPANYHE